VAHYLGERRYRSKILQREKLSYDVGRVKTTPNTTSDLEANIASQVVLNWANMASTLHSSINKSY
jgi:hypothetical protein